MMLSSMWSVKLGNQVLGNQVLGNQVLGIGDLRNH